MCLYPKFILNRKYLPNKKNNGIPPTITDQRTKYVPVGCGKCMECRKQKAREWRVRLHEELRHNNKNVLFVTLSFSEQSLIELDKEIDQEFTGYTRDNKIATLAVRRFLERWRKEFKASLKHWFITELGQNNTERIHIHGLVFPPNGALRHDKNLFASQINDKWKYGNTWIGDYVNERTVNYIVKYLSKQDTVHKYYTPVILCSKGIGANYMSRSDSKRNAYNEKKTIEHYTTRNGIKLALPIYYRNKIYTDEQREKLWINLLDKQIRYVNGIKIDVSNSEKAYFNLLKNARLENERLGYGNGNIDWNLKRYEQHLRNLKRMQRLANEKAGQRTPCLPQRPAKGHFAGASRPVATGLAPSVYKQQSSIVEKKANAH